MSNSRIDFIFDLETIGANVHACPIVDMAYATFEYERFTDDPYTFEHLVKSVVKTLKPSISEQMTNYNCSYKRSDVEWWKSLPDHAKNKIKPLPTDLTMNQFYDSINQYLNDQKKIDYWWSRGNTFDPVILWRLMDEKQKALFDNKLKFYKVRDIRTHIDAKFNYDTVSNFIPVSDTDYWYSTFVAHDSTHDVAADILRLQAIYRAENDLPQMER